MPCSGTIYTGGQHGGKICRRLGENSIAALQFPKAAEGAGTGSGGANIDGIYWRGVMKEGEQRMIKKTFPEAALVLCLASAAAVAQAPAAHLTIQADQQIAPVSETLYGLMTEEINYSYEGGLYAEMVRNRNFRGDWSGILYWYLVENGNAVARMAADKDA